MAFWQSKKKLLEDYKPFAIQEGHLKFGQIKEYSFRKRWVEDVFASSSDLRQTLASNFNFSKIFIFYIGFFILLSTLIGRTAYLQILKNNYYYDLAEGNRIRIERLEAKRGVIYDVKGRPLVRNVANFMLYFIPTDLPRDEVDKNRLFERIAEVLKINPIDIKTIVEQVKPGTYESLRPLFIVDNIPYEMAMKLYLESDNMPGVIWSNKTKREYNNYSVSLSHVLGYTGKINQEELDKYGDEYMPIDYIGKMGIEYFWENELKGKGGRKEIEVDAMGKEKRVISIEDPQDGRNLVLTIDLEMQKKLEDLIVKQISKAHLTRGVGVVMDPRTGEVRAMVSLPAFNNNTFARGITQSEYKSLLDHPDRPLLNRAVSGEFPSGSVIKPVMSAAALEEGLINENTSFLSNGGIRVGEWFFPDWKAGGHGTTNVRKAIAQSVNTFFYITGGGYNDFVGLGVDRIAKYFNQFGLGHQTGIDLNGEVDGFVPSKEWKESAKGERWYIGDTYHLSIGQGDLLVTPLQVANYTSFFANSGKLMRPHLLKLILSANDKVLEEADTKPVREKIIKDYNVRIVREGMRQTVTSGSARSMSSLPVEAAGKTGTAQFSTKKKPHAWFTGFAPYENPELVVTILIEEGQEGSTIAVPIAREFMQWYFGEYRKK